MSTTRSELQKKAQSAVLQYAFLRWESAVVLAGTILLTVFLRHPLPWWPWWGWPLLGLLGLAALAYSSLNDPDANARVIQSLLREHFDVNRLRDQALRTDLESALEYQKHIEIHARKQREGALRTKLEDTANQIVDWIGHMYRLALRLDAYRFDVLLAKERALVPKEIDELTARRKQEDDAVVQQKLDEVLASKQNQLQMLAALDVRMRQAELQMEQSLTALATVYSQIQLVDAQDVGGSRSERLAADIQEQIERLNDLVSSINEVYDYHDAGAA